MKYVEISLLVARNYGQNAPEFLRGVEMSREMFAEWVRYAERNIADIELPDGNKLAGTTTTRGVGQWLGKIERVAIVSTWVLPKHKTSVLNAIRNIATAIKRGSFQDSVAITVKPIEVDFS